MQLNDAATTRTSAFIGAARYDGTVPDPRMYDGHVIKPHGMSDLSVSLILFFSIARKWRDWE